MERQCLLKKADKDEYKELYRDAQPGQNVYWNGFGQPPTLSFRADFDDTEFNRERQFKRELIKARFGGGNLGFIEAEDLELFYAVYNKPLTKPTGLQQQIFELIKNSGPFNIQQIKEESGLLVKQITPILHRLQEAFLIYEDQFDGEWDRSWVGFSEMFPNANTEKFSKIGALKILLMRFAYRLVWFDSAMAKSFYKVPLKDIKQAIDQLLTDGALVPSDTGYMLKSDAEFLESYEPKKINFVYAIHRNDFLYKSHEHILKDNIKKLTNGLPYDCEPLQHLLIDGEFHGASVGHFRNGPYDLNDIVCDLPEAHKRKDDILKAVSEVNFGKIPLRFMGENLK